MESSVIDQQKELNFMTFFSIFDAKGLQLTLSVVLKIAEYLDGIRRF